MKFGRREFLIVSTGAAVHASSAFAQVPPILDEAVPVRHNVATDAGREMLAQYANAVKQMRDLPPNDPRSWAFQWNVHAVPNVTGKASAIQDAFGDEGSPARLLATEIWSSCEPHFSNRSDLFLPWHRYYLVAFEQIIREILNDPSFALPYWDYTALGQRSIPEEFRLALDEDWEPLFQENRRRSGFIDINAGEPMDKGATRSPFTLDVMRRTRYSGPFGFCAAIDRGIHGNVHGGVGDGTNMGSISTAAGDPIFWLHHCNIDRIWSGWIESGGQTPQFDHSFVFAAPTGDRLEYDGSNVQDTASLGYGYDTVPIAQRPDEITVAAAGQEAKTISASAQPIQLGVAEVSVPLQVEPGEASISTTSDSNSRYFVILDGLSTNVDPNVLFDVFIDLPSSAGPDEKLKHYVGTFSFFGAEGHHSHGAGPNFEVTEVVQALGQSGSLKPESVITIIPIGVPSIDASPSVSRIQLVAQ